MAYSNSETEESKLRALDIFAMNEDKWSILACNGALNVLLQTQQFEELIELANRIRRKGIKWGPFTYDMVALAHIRSKSIARAKKVLRVNSMNMNNCGQCYRELIEYLTTHESPLEVCQHYREMVQSTRHLHFSEWCNALELALEFPDRALYWGFRKQLFLCGHESFEDELPPHLLLPEREEDSNKQTLASSLKNQKVPVTTETLSLALESFCDVQKAGGAHVTKQIAEKLLETFAKHKRVDMCVEVLGYCQEQDIFPRTRELSMAFPEVYAAGRFRCAVQIFAVMYKRGSRLPAWVFGQALDSATKLHERDIMIATLRQ